jgi:hypothetical protein
MAAIVFPTSPTTNQAYSANGTTWIWDGTTWNAFTPAPSVAWAAGTLDSGNASGSTGSAITTSTIAPGIPSPYGNTGAIMGSNGTQWVINPSTTNINSLGVGTTASGTAGSIRATSITFSDATTQTSAFTGFRSQVFTSSGTFTIPANITSIKVTLVGSGGAGGGLGQAGAGGGGGASGVGYQWFTGLTPANTLSVTVGAGGTAVSGGSGGAGGTVSVASGTQTITTLQATGGGGGQASTGGSNPATGGTAGVVTGASISFAGAAGTTSDGINQVTGSATAAYLGGGWGSGGSGAYDANASAGYGYGSGGGSVAYSSYAFPRAGGAGAKGIVIIEW